MDLQSLYHSIKPISLHLICGFGTLNWFFVLTTTCFIFKKNIKDKISDDYQQELKKIKLSNIHSFKMDLINEYKYSFLIFNLYFISMLMGLGSILILVDSSKWFLCISYLTLPILEIVIFKMAKCKLKEKLDNNEVIRINKCPEKEPTYKLNI